MDVEFLAADNPQQREADLIGKTSNGFADGLGWLRITATKSK